jgi:3-mercaptopyruvate sulfurtransferase SseA
MKNRVSVLLALTAVVVAVFIAWHSQRPAAIKTYTWHDVQAEARAGGYRLITTEALAEKYRQNPSESLLVDTRQPWEYRTGHIAGAVNFPMEPTRWERWRKARALGQLLGQDKERRLVFY